MKVDGNGAVRSGVRTGARSAASGTSGDFAARLAGGTQQRPAVAGGMPIGNVGALLALQGVEDPMARRKRATRRASSLLDALEGIRLGLLQGGMPRDNVERLAALVAEARAEIDDPGLSQVLDEIDLRAQVELAKLQVAANTLKR